jgi:peptidyl-prolyl cis-trans isomerase D
MAVIGKIRKQSTILLIAIGGAMVLFVLGDLFTSGSTFFAGPNDEVGEIDGKKVSIKEFEMRMAQAVQNRFGGNVDEETRVQLRDQIWDEIVRENVIAPQMEELGLSVSDQELFYVIKNDPQNPILRSYFSNPQTGRLYQQFANPDGTINSDRVIAYFQNVLNGDPSQDENVLQAQQSFQVLKKNLRSSILDEKYASLLGKSIYATSLEIEKKSEESSKSMSISYAAKYFNEMDDSKYEPTESEMKSYYSENKNEARFKQEEPLRSLQYVTFEVLPTADDTNRLRTELEEVKKAFSYAEDDTLFVNENSDTPFNIRWTTGTNLPQGMDSLVMNASKDSIFGPYRNENKFELLKVKDFKQAPDSVKASHILLSAEQVDTATARQRLDSLRTVIRENDNFAQLASQYSMDGSRTKGGDLGWFAEGQMVPAFSNGDMPIVASQYGMHLIKITDQTDDVKKALVAIIDNMIEPGERTFQDVYAEASSFAINNNNADKFMENGEKFGIAKAPSVRPNDRTLMGIEGSREIVQWAYGAEVGAVSDVFDLQDQYVVALLSEVREKGILPFDLVKDNVKLAVLNQKKTSAAKEMVENNQDLESIAQKWDGIVQQSEPFTFADFTISGIGVEPKIQGTAYALQPKSVSEPIEGQRAVYVIRLDNTQKVPSSVTRSSIEQRYSRRAGVSAKNAIKENAQIEDNRAQFY